MIYLGWFLIILGLVFTMIAGIGLMKMPQFFMKMQVVSKAATLGTVFCLIGLCLLFPSTTVAVKALLVVLFLVISTPTGTHAMAESARDVDYE